MARAAAGSTVTRAMAGVWLPIVLIATLSAGCVGGAVDKIVDQINRTTDAIAAESGAWRDELSKLSGELRDLENQVDTDAKGIVADTANAVSDLTAQALSMTNEIAQGLIADAGAEFRCNVDFVKQGVVDQLRYLASNLKFWEEHKTTIAGKPSHEVCAMLPRTLTLHPVTAGWAIDSAAQAPGIVEVVGYNFEASALPSIEVQDLSGARVRDADVSAAFQTRYVINLNFTRETFPDAETGIRFVLRWPDTGGTNSLDVLAVKPAHVAITHYQWQPAVPVMGRDPVVLSVSLLNEGGQPSGRFEVIWTPDATKPAQTEAVDPAHELAAGEPGTVTLSHVYPAAGRFTSQVRISTGSDISTFTVDIASDVASVSTCRVDQPNVTQPWTPVMGGPDCALRPGDRLQVVQAGGCVNTGGSGNTTKLYVAPKDPDCRPCNTYFGTLAIPGTLEEGAGTPIGELLASHQVIVVGSGVPNPVLELGYVDNGYGDNGYWGMGDEGNCGQCRGQPNAYVVITITHLR
jgi:hypothetical protein